VLVNRQAGATDVAHAITLLQDAARDSESDAAVDAQMLLGLIYASGVHGPEDDVKASEYFKGSSSLSRTGYAEYWAGMMFQQGEKGFIEPNKQKALHWLNVSCLEGLIPAAKSLTGSVKDKKKPGAIAPGFVFYWAVLSNLPSTSRS
jgi:TPR repeat protein